MVCGGLPRRLLCLAASADGDALAASGAARVGSLLMHCSAVCRHAWQMLLPTPLGPCTHTLTTLSRKAMRGRAPRSCCISVLVSWSGENQKNTRL